MANPIGFLPPAFKIPQVSHEETKEIPQPINYDYVSISVLKNFKGYILKPSWIKYFQTEYPEYKESTETILISSLVLALLLDIWCCKDTKSAYSLPEKIKKELKKDEVAATRWFISDTLNLEEFDINHGLMKLEFYDLIKTQAKRRKVDNKQIEVLFINLNINKLNEISKER